MSSFKSIGAEGGAAGGFNTVSAGIAEALVATAAGILIAVVALMFYNFLQTQVQVAFQEFKDKVEDLAQYITIARDRREGNSDMPPVVTNSNNNSRGQQQGRGYKGANNGH